MIREIETDPHLLKLLNDDTELLYDALCRRLGEDEALDALAGVLSVLGGTKLYLKSRDVILGQMDERRAKRMLARGASVVEVTMAVPLPPRRVKEIAGNQIADDQPPGREA